jgi:pimeloyl-ACP methyl ester carboxylesterase
MRLATRVAASDLCAMAGREITRAGLAAALAAGMSCAPVLADPSLTVERTTTLAQLYSPAEAASLSSTLPADRTLHFRVRTPRDPVPGVLVYVSPTDSGELSRSLSSVLDDRHLLYVAADGFGNNHPTAERMLVAVSALKLARQLGVLDGRRLYIGGMSGGGRIASQVVTHFPQLFSGALCIVGADYFMPRDEALRSQIAARRLAFITGDHDFNQRELRLVTRRYRQAGVSNVLLIDLPQLGHELPPAEVFAQALDYLAPH